MKTELLERLALPPAAAQRAPLTRQDLLALGWERRAVDAILRGACVKLPGYSRPVVTVASLDAYLEQHTYRDDRVRPS